MHFLKNNKIFRKSFLGFFTLFMLLAPVSASFTTKETAYSTIVTGVAVQQNVTNAAVVVPLVAGAAAITATYYGFTKAVNLLGNLILTTAAAFTWFGGKLLEWSLEYTVFNMGERINGTLGIAINNMWGLIRDICNLIFVFGFIYTGIRTIVDPEGADTKRFLSRIIIGALLVNFSLFIVKFVVDFSNFLSLRIFETLTSSDGSISATIAQSLGLITVYTFKDSSGAALAELFGNKSFWFFIFGAIFLLTTAFVFIAASILLIVRFIALIFIMVASPVLFAATVFPQTEEYASELWKKLFSYAFFAPAYLLFTLISIHLIKSMGISSGSFVNALTDTSGGGFSVILNFVIVIGFMIGSLVLASKMGIAGGEMAVKVGENLRHRAQNVALRYGSLKVRQFEGAEHGKDYGSIGLNPKTWQFAKRFGSHGVGHFIKRTPALGLLQLAGHKAVHDIEEAKKKVLGMRTAESKEALNTFIKTGKYTKWMDETGRLAHYNNIKANSDLDELEPEQMEDYKALLEKYNLGKREVRTARPDAFGNKRSEAYQDLDENGKIKLDKDGEEVYDFEDRRSDAEKNIAYMKKAEDVGTAKLHKVVVSLEGDGTSGPDRELAVNDTLQGFYHMGNGAMIGGIARRNDAITQKYMEYIREQITAGVVAEARGAGKSEKEIQDIVKKIDYKDAAEYKKLFDNLALDSEKRLNSARKALAKAHQEGDHHRADEIKKRVAELSEKMDRNKSSAEWFESAPQVRLLGLEIKNNSKGGTGQKDTKSGTSIPQGYTMSSGGILIPGDQNGNTRGASASTGNQVDDDNFVIDPNE